MHVIHYIPIHDIEKIYTENNGICGPESPNGIRPVAVIRLKNQSVWYSYRDIDFEKAFIRGEFQTEL